MPDILSAPLVELPRAKDTYEREIQHFEVIRQVLIDIRDANGIEALYGWDKLETYTTLIDLGQCYGVSMKDYGVPFSTYLYKINLGDCSLTGTLPSSLAKLDTLVVLWLYNNNLQGSLPAHIGSPSCLPNLKDMDVGDNKQLGGTIDAQFLVNCKHCNANGCQSGMKFPYLSGASLSSADITLIFTYAPMDAIGRVQVEVAEIDREHLEYAKFTAHLPASLAATNSTWNLWQHTWLSELRQITSGYLFIFVTREDAWGKESRSSFKAKFKSSKYTAGAQDTRNGVFNSGEDWCRLHSFDRSFGFDDEGWDFTSGTKATTPLDFERLHLEAVSKKHNLKTVFITFGWDGQRHAQQVLKPPWYPYSGVLAPLDSFAFGGKDASGKWEERLVRGPNDSCACCCSVS
jgi:hypothetical protein